MLPEVVYTPRSSESWRTLGPALVRDLASSRDLAWRLLVRDIRAQYRQSVLGYLWALLPPILLAASLTLASRASILNVEDLDVPYPLFVLIGTVLWQTFAEAISGPLAALTAAKPLLARIRFPYEAIVLAKLGEVLFNLGLKVLLVAGALIYYQIEVGPWLLMAPLAIGVLILLGTGLGLLLAPLGGLYEDVSRALPLLLGLWFLLTPVVYQSPAAGSFVEWMNFLNPATAPLVIAREALTTGAATQLFEFGVVNLLTLPLLLVGWCFYRFSMPFVIERISA